MDAILAQSEHAAPNPMTAPDLVAEANHRMATA